MDKMTPDTVVMSVEYFDALREALGEKDEVIHTPTNRKARRARQAEMRKAKGVN